MKIKKFLIPILLFLSCMLVFTACNNQGDNDAVNESEIAEFIANYDRRNPFVDNKVVVCLTEEASFNNIFHDYTAEDFSGIGAVNVEELDGRTTVSNGLTYRIRQYLLEDASGNTIPEYHKHHKRFFCITLDKNDEDNVLRAVYILRQRSDIYSAGPNVIESGDV